MSGKALGSTFFDSRWVGPHGIGRFAAEIQQRIEFAGEIRCAVSPSHPLDAFAMSLYLCGHPRATVYSPGFNAPLLGLGRYVLTVHDLNHIDIPGHGLLKRLYYRLILRRACRRAARVLTVSEYSRRRIVAWANLPDSHVVNVGNGVGAVFRPEGPAFSPGYRYFLCVSNRKAHKNEGRMIRAFAQAEVDHSVRLLVTGEATAELQALVEQLALVGRVAFTGRLNDEALAEYYRGATGLLFASLYEGFGLPIVEAMSCGVPVITSNVTAMPEIAGDAALLVNPLSIADIASAITDIANNNGGIASRLQRKGLERSAAFEWEQVASRVFEQLRDLG